MSRAPSPVPRPPHSGALPSWTARGYDGLGVTRQRATPYYAQTLVCHNACLHLSPRFAPAQTPEIMAADLEPKTVEAFNHYVQVTEARIDRQMSRPGAFLYIEGLPEPQHGNPG